MKPFKFWLLALAAILALGSCKKTETNDSAGITDTGTSTSKITVSVLNSSNTVTAALAQAVGQATAANLTSLKYFISSVQICETMTVNGSGFSGQSGCLTLYSTTSTANYDTYLAPEAAADTTNYIDLMTSAGRASLANTVTLDSSSVHSYNWGLINWYRPIKVTAKVDLNDSTSLYTKAGTTVTESGSGLNSTYITQITESATAPAAESVVVLPNGGSWFKFQQPFVISTADLEAGSSFQLGLAFNPEGIIKGYSSSTRTGLGIKDTGTAKVIHVPMLDLSPIVYKTGDTPMKESYLLKYTGTAITPVNIRLELYYLNSDTTKAIYGVDGKYLYIASSTDELGDFYKTSYITTATDGTLEFQDWAQKSFLKGFSRLTTVGATGTAKLDCTASAGFGTCTIGTLDVTTELVSVGAVQ